MSEIEGDLGSFAVNPKTYRPLRGFTCGEGKTRAEREVDEMTSDYARGRRSCTIFRATVEQPGGQLVGVVAIQPANVTQPDGQVSAAYISVIGVSVAYRGRRKAGARPGDHVLRDALQTISVAWKSMPAVFAMVDPNNDPSCNLFRRHGFEVVVPAEQGNDEADSLFGRPAVLLP
jgi:ribosomal protein S18 acetylase RimI-like enzyme